MTIQREPLPAVAAAGITAIVIGSAAAILSILAILVSIFISLFPYGGIVFGVIGLLISMAGLAFCICLVIFAISVVRQRRWARIPFLISAAVVCIVSLLLILGLLANGGSSPSQTPQVAASASSLGANLSLLLIIPFGLSVWWLVLFTRPSIIAVFNAVGSVPVGPIDSTQPGISFGSVRNASFVPSTRQSTSCPTPVLVVAIFLLLSGALSLLSLLHPSSRSLPVFFFGAVLSPNTGWLVTTLVPLLMAGFALALIRLKGFAIDVILVLQVMLVINILAALASPSFVRTLYEATLASAPYATATREYSSMASSVRLFMALHALYLLALVCTLASSRNRFLRAVADSRHLSS